VNGGSFATQLYQAGGVNHIDEAAPRRFLVRVMLTLLENIALLILVAVSLGGFAAAMTWMFAVWFGERG
jgi:hypothetical protein